MDLRERLAEMAAQGMTMRAMAAELGISHTTVRRRLRKYGIDTQRTRRLKDGAEARMRGAATMASVCPRHGPTLFTKSPSGTYRCLRCRSDAVSRRRRAVKEALIAAAGGCCELCGYSRSPAALQFHHADPITKQFAISERGVTRRLEAALEEVRKCVLLCATCHAEVEAGVATLPEKLSA